MTVNSRIPQTNEKSFGSPPPQYSQAWFLAFTSQIMRRLSLLTGPYDAQRTFLMQSPDERVWEVTIDNTGALKTTLVDRSDNATRKERPPI